VIDLREEHDKNAFASMPVNSDSVSYEMNESELQYVRQCEERI
jgi:hypothetical protein